jgi:hypothetical protein
MAETLDDARKRKHESWLRDWANGLAHCLECDHEYTNAQVIVIEDEKSCPSCKSPENKKYYYCPSDGSSGCECEVCS